MSRKVRIKRQRVSKKNQPKETITFEEFERLRCAHCGGAHLRACPRIKRMAFHTSGALNEIEFWQDGQWDASNIIWPEETISAGESDE